MPRSLTPPNTSGPISKTTLSLILLYWICLLLPPKPDLPVDQSNDLKSCSDPSLSMPLFLYAYARTLYLQESIV